MFLHDWFRSPMLPLRPSSAIRCNQTVTSTKISRNSYFRIVEPSPRLTWLFGALYTDCLTYIKTQPQPYRLIGFSVSDVYVAAYHYSVNIWFDNYPLYGLKGPYLCPRSRSIRHAMLRPGPFSLAGECPNFSASNRGSGLRSQIIAYWLSSTWHVSRCSSVDMSSPS